MGMQSKFGIQSKVALIACAFLPMVMGWGYNPNQTLAERMLRAEQRHSSLPVHRRRLPSAHQWTRDHHVPDQYHHPSSAVELSDPLQRRLEEFMTHSVPMRRRRMLSKMHPRHKLIQMTSHRREVHKRRFAHELKHNDL